MGFIAAGAGAVLGIGAAVGGYLMAPKTAPKFDYKGALKDLKSYTNKSLGTLSGVQIGAYGGDATYNPVDAVTTGNQAINFNMANMGNYGAMAQQSNDYALNDKLKALDTISPDWQSQRDQAAKNNNALLHGEIPLDVQQSMARNSAYQSFQSGYSGSPSGRQGTLARDLGMTSLGLQQLGSNDAQNWLKTNNAIAMPDQVSASDMMKQIGFDANLTTNTALTNEKALTETQLQNTQNRTQYNQYATGSQLQKAGLAIGIYGDEMNGKNAVRSQKLADQQAQTEMTGAANAALWGGIGSSVGGAMGMLGGMGGLGGGK